MGYHYHLTDWLGAKRMQTTASGNQEKTCMSYPFGDGLSCTGGPDATEHHFTGKERDTESGLDYFKARYLTSDLGRFMTADWASKPTAVPYADFGNPQSLDLYVYALNNPLERDDIDGHDWRDYLQKAQKWAADHPRTMSALKATAAAVVTTAAVVALVATAPVSVPATIVGAVLAGAGTALATVAVAGGAVATATYTVAAISGNKELDEGAEGVQTVTNPAGYVTTTATGGNLEAGGYAANAYDMLTGDPTAALAATLEMTGGMLSAVSSQAGQDQTEQPPTDSGVTSTPSPDPNGTPGTFNSRSPNSSSSQQILNGQTQ